MIYPDATHGDERRVWREDTAQQAPGPGKQWGEQESRKWKQGIDSRCPVSVAPKRAFSGEAKKGGGDTQEQVQRPIWYPGNACLPLVDEGKSEGEVGPGRAGQV